jgi:molybdate transport system substrate-binding protein
MNPSIRMISSMATRELLAELASSWQAKSGQPVDAVAAGGVDVAKRLRAGEPFDVVVLARDAIDGLSAEGLLRPDSRVDLVRSGIAVAVPAAGPRPDIGTEEALRQAVLGASSLGYSTGPSGNYLLKLFERWGILEQVRPRFVQPPPGVPVGRLIAQGQVALGFQQMSELMNLPGIAVLGPLPQPVQSLTVFTAALHAGTDRPDAADALVDHLRSDAVAQVKRRHGMEPA